MKKNNLEYPWYKYYTDMKKNIDYPDVSLYEMVRRCASKHPGLIAYSYYSKAVTYKNYLKKIDESACAYIRLGVKKGDFVSIISPNTPEAIISFYALNKLGAICNMIHPLSSPEEIKFAINKTKSKYAFVSDVAYHKVKSVLSETTLEKIVYASVSESMDPLMKFAFKLTKGRKLESVSGEESIPYYRFISRAKFHKGVVKDTGKGKDEAVILYSGGTTGKQKAIVLTNKNFNALALSLLEINKVLGPGVSTLSIMPIFHGFGLGCTFHAVNISGGHAIILPSFSPKEFDSIILKYKPNIIACVPSLLEGLTTSKKLRDEDLSFIECVVCGGDAISEKLNKKIDDFLYDHGSIARVRGAYGMSECVAGVTMVPIEESKFGSIGIPAPDAIIKICKPNTLNELPYGEVGEIVINSPTIMKEYLDDERETKNVLKKDKDGNIWLHSGDLGYMDEDGFIFFKSRLKRMIVSSGYNIYPSVVEQIILEHPYVDKCVVVGVPHPYKKEVIKAYIVLKEGLVLNSEIKKSIRSHCEKYIASYSLPYAYGYRKELPVTKLGKVAYRELINDKDEEK